MSDADRAVAKQVSDGQSPDFDHPNTVPLSFHHRIRRLRKEKGPTTSRPSQKQWQLACGVLYGSGPARFAQEMGVTESEARVQIEAFKASVPGVERWRKKLIETASRASPPSVETICGRRRILSSLAPDAALTATGCEDAKRRFRLDRSADERRAVNTACQGSAADVVKRAMIAVFDELDQSSRAVQIHGELLFG